MRYYVIVNPIAGRGRGEKSIPQIETSLRESGLDFTLARTERVWHAAELAEAAVRNGYDIVVCASGDGTANECINGIMNAKKAGCNSAAFGALSVGTGNDFAFGAGMPGDLESGLKAIKQNKRRKIDIGFVKGGDYPQGRYFGNGIGVGFDAAVGSEAVKLRWARGLPAYLIGALRTVFLYYDPPQVEITLDDKERIIQPSLMISIMNGKRMGGGFKMTPESKPDDGCFDLCIAEGVSKGRVFTLIPHFLRGTQMTQPEVKMRRAKKVSIRSLDKPFPAHADGEFVCLEGVELTLEILPRELEVICG